MAIGRIPEPGTGIPESILDAKGDLISASAADTPARLAVGTNETRLVAASGETAGLKWVADTTNYAIAAKGDLLVGTAADTVGVLGVGTNGYTIVADSAETTGLKWAAPSAGAYVLVKARTTFTAVADTGTTFDNVFTSTYKNYIVIVDNLVSSTTGNQLRWRHRYGSATSQTTYYGAQIQLNVLATFYNIAGNNVNYAELGEIYNADYSLHNILVSGTNNSDYYMPISTTGFSSAKNGPINSGWQATTKRDYHGFQLSVASGTMTGTVAIYGMVAS